MKLKARNTLVIVTLIAIAAIVTLVLMPGDREASAEYVYVTSASHRGLDVDWEQDKLEDPASARDLLDRMDEVGALVCDIPEADVRAVIVRQFPSWTHDEQSRLGEILAKQYC